MSAVARYFEWILLLKIREDLSDLVLYLLPIKRHFILNEWSNAVVGKVIMYRRQI